MPELQLDATEVAEVMASDAHLERQLQPDPEATALDRLLLQLGEVERGIEEPAEHFNARRKAMRDGVLRLAERQGHRAPAALRARALARVESAMAGTLPEAEIPAVMGTFSNQLQRHRLMVGGRILAPHFVVRTLYKARWNLAHGLPNDHAMLPVEARALHGWMGLHATELSTDARLAALKRYDELGGEHALEAQGVLLYQAGDYALAALALQRAHDQHPGHLRIRNHAIAARVVGELDL